MRKLMTAGCFAATVTAALCLFAGVATARRFSISSISFRSAWEQMTFRGGVNSVRCDVTMEGTLHERNVTKMAFSLIGYVTRATTQECMGGSVFFPPETLPWHVQYSSFTGTLPIITLVGLIFPSLTFRIQPTGQVTCVAVSTAREPASWALHVEPGNEVTEINWNPFFEVSLGFCPWAARAFLSGNGTATVLGGVARITIRLI